MSEEFDIEELLRAHLLDDQKVPPAGLFEQIDAELSKKPKKRRGIWLFLFGLGSFTLLALVVPTNYFIGTNELEMYTSKCALEYTYRNDSRTSFAEIRLEEEELTDAQFSIEASNFERILEEKEGIDYEKNSKGESKIKGNETPAAIKSQPKKDSMFSTGSAIGELQKTVNNKDVEGSVADSIKRSMTAKNDAVLNREHVDLTKTEQEKDTSSTDTIPELTLKDSIDDTKEIAKFGLLAYGGPALFEAALFKSYFVSGALSDFSFPSSSYEIGVGVYHQFFDRFQLQADASFNTIKSQFTYDLLITEADYFELYESGEQIPIENLDDPDECNCYLVEDASLSYTLNSFAFTIGSSYHIIQRPKFNFGPVISFSGILSTKFINKNSEIIAFPVAQNEKFKSSRLQFGLGFHYAVTARFQIGIIPSYGIQFNNSSLFYAEKLNRLLFPISLKIAL